MDFDKLTIKSGEAVASAQELARRTGKARRVTGGLPRGMVVHRIDPF